MVLRIAVRVVAMAVGTIFVGLVGGMIGIWSLNVTLTVVIPSVLMIALVLAMTRAFGIRDRRAADHAGRPSHQLLIAAGLAYGLSLAAWGGQSLFGHLLVPAGFWSALIDFVVWMTFAVVGVRLGDRARVQASTAPVPYA